jgi:preprotein translocase subunit SecY
LSPLGLTRPLHPFSLAELRARLPRLVGLLLVVRLTAHLPLFPGLPGLTSRLQADPYLTLLDVFSGGAVACGSVLSLGVVPLALAWPVAAMLRRRWDSPAMAAKRFEILWPRIAVLISLPLGWLYPAFLESVAGFSIPRQGFLVALTLTVGTVVSLAFGYLLQEDSPAKGLKLLVAFHVLATLPRYLFAGAASFGETSGRVLIAAAVAAVYVILSQGARRLPVQLANRRPSSSTFLELPLNVSGVAPMLWILAAFGVLRQLAHFLAFSEAGSFRRLAGAVLRLTDLSAAEGWLAFLLLAFLTRWAVHWASVPGAEWAESMRKGGSFIPGVRPGRATARFIDRALGRIAWIEPLLTVVLLAAVAFGALRLQPASRWPVLLIPVLFAALPLDSLAFAWKSHSVMKDYDGFIKRKSKW